MVLGRRYASNVHRMVTATAGRQPPAGITARGTTMQLTISINLDNDSFQEDSGTELAILFREIQRKFEHIRPPVGTAQAIRDTNGNTVGKFLIKEDNDAE
jgi:hypothetical protein